MKKRCLLRSSGYKMLVTRCGMGFADMPRTTITPRQTVFTTNSITQLIRMALLAVSLLGLVQTTGCCKLGSNKASWAAGDTGPAVVDVTRRLPNGQQDNGVVRSGPGFEYGKITSLPSGTQVTVTSNKSTPTGYWSQVKYAGGTGWMHQDILLKSREQNAGNNAFMTGRYSAQSTNGRISCDITQNGQNMGGSCSDGLKIEGRVDRNSAICSWTLGGASGKGFLIQTANGSLVGTWGNGASNDNGGTWSMTPN